MSPHRYITESLAATGFAIVDNKVAWTLRPDLWSSPHAVMAELAEPDPPLPGMHRLVAHIGQRRVLVLARSMTRLEGHIEEVTGLQVTGVALAAPIQKPALQQDVMTAHRQRHADDRQAHIERLAKQEPPAHDCALRKEILAARAELEGSSHASA